MTAHRGNLHRLHHLQLLASFSPFQELRFRRDVWIFGLCSVSETIDFIFCAAAVHSPSFSMSPFVIPVSTTWSNSRTRTASDIDGIPSSKEACRSWNDLPFFICTGPMAIDQLAIQLPRAKLPSSPQPLSPSLLRGHVETHHPIDIRSAHMMSTNSKSLSEFVSMLQPFYTVVPLVAICNRRQSAFAILF